MPKAARKQSANRYDDKVTNRTLIVFAFIFVSVMLLMQCYRIFDQMVGGLALIHVLWIVAGVFAALTAAALVWLLAALARKKKLTLPLNLLLLFFLVAASCVIMATRHLAGVLFLYAALPSAALLYLVYFIYQREFFALAASCGGAILVLWILHGWQDAHPFRALCLGLLAALLALALTGVTVLLRRDGGVLKLGNRSVSLFGARTLYKPMLVTLPLLAAVCLAAAFLPQFAYALMLVLCAYLFLLAVYFTVKLM